MTKLELQNEALSTSGTYRKFFIDEKGVKRGHIINPKTGFPVRHELVSVSIISESAILSDATATAMMAMGFENAKAYVKQKNNIEAFLIYETDDGLKSWQTTNLRTKD
jgi:thiamine biosynthesis lipoprotein